MGIMTGPTIRETNLHISVVLHSPTVASQDSKREAERVGRRFALLKDKKSVRRISSDTVQKKQR